MVRYVPNPNSPLKFDVVTTGDYVNPFASNRAYLEAVQAQIAERIADNDFLIEAHVAFEPPGDAQWLQSIGIEPIEPQPKHEVSGLTLLQRAMQGQP